MFLPSLWVPSCYSSILALARYVTTTILINSTPWDAKVSTMHERSWVFYLFNRVHMPQDSRNTKWNAPSFKKYKSLAKYNNMYLQFQLLRKLMQKDHLHPAVWNQPGQHSKTPSQLVDRGRGLFKWYVFMFQVKQDKILNWYMEI